MTAPARILTVAKIKQTVALYYELPVRMMTSHDRHRAFAWPRQIAMLLTRRMITRPCANPEKRAPIIYSDIAHLFDREESTVHHGIERAEHRIATDPDTARAVREITAVLELGE